jgi:ABC-type dipeptide/oligopeptide/nickel transport system permease component
MVVVVTIVFLLISLNPGDQLSVMLGPDATPGQIEATPILIGLDRRVHGQFLKCYVSEGAWALKRIAC